MSIPTDYPTTLNITNVYHTFLVIRIYLYKESVLIFLLKSSDICITASQICDMALCLLETSCMKTLLFCLSTDADSTCPKDSNPLQLEPSEVIGEHGDEVIVNCTSSSEDHDGMYWINGDNRTDSQEDAAFFPYSVSLSDYNVTAECKIKVNSSECGKELGITIYITPLSIFHVKAMVEGEQYELHCDIHEVAPVQNLTVRWYKDSQLIHTDSFTDTIKTQVNMSSILTINISRGDSGVQFKCEAQLDFGPSGPVTPVLFATYNISVDYAPEFKGNTTDLISVKEGDDVTLNCEAEGNPPPSFHWTRDGVNLMANTSNLSITQVMAGSVYTCTAHNYLGTPTKLYHTLSSVFILLGLFSKMFDLIM
uniref:Ig-like domain-containing protein n=1 Tax=Lates calcarifer TaxID=8187 RepID=A0A4W6FY77_LATCA